MAALAGILAGELLGRSRLRLPVVLLGLVGAVLFGRIVEAVAVQYTLVPSLLGTVATHWLGVLLSVGVTTLVLLCGSRVLARRGPAFDVVELGVLAALFAGAVASHRDGSIARPLWLTDLCWSFGIDPGRVLLAGGGALTAVLAGLLLLGSPRRKPLGALLGLPLLVLTALLFVSATPVLDLQEPPDVGMGAMGDEEPEDGQAEQGAGGQGGAGQGRPEDGENGEGGGAQGDRPSDGGQQAPDPLAGESGGEDKPVAVLLLDDDHEPPSGYWYLRQDVLPAYNGKRLIASDVEGTHADVLDHFPVEPEQLGDGATRARKTVRGSVSLVVDHPVPFAPASPIAYAPRGNPSPARFKRSYRFASAMLTAPLKDLVREPVGDPLWSPALRAHYLEAPDDPRYAELADQIVADLTAAVADQLPPGMEEPPPFLQAVAVVQWIGDNMQYSKREKHADAADPTASFLFGNRIGYCVHTAHAAVYLWRKLGIPSRVATGYAVEDAHRRGGTLVVMGGTAHAWPELYLEGIGWVPLDVSPAEDLDESQGLPPDEEELRALGDLARDAPDLPGPRPDYTFVRQLATWAASTLVATAVLGLLALHWLVKGWRRARPVFAPPATLSRVGYRAALDLLVDAGHVRAPGETREAFARRLEPVLPSLTVLTAWHLRGALGRPGAADPERDRVQWTGQLARLRHEIRGTTPWWRRLLGPLDPTTFYRSR
jgi:transglutaminase-like putative cysteine protease